ncbi:MAG: hypothetical protein AAFV72_15395 [Cyanobacteria bacterium J06635_1]
MDLSKLGARLIIALALLVPFGLRELSSSLEPYPAILQPSGATRISTQDTQLKFYEMQIVAMRADGSEQRLEPREFMGKIPTQYWTHIARTHFGLGPAKTQNMSLGIWTLTATTIKSASPPERAEALSWIHTRLRALGVEDAHTLRVRQIKILFDLQTSTETKREITEQIDVDITQ